MQGNALALAGNFGIASLVWATDIDVLPTNRQVQRRDAYWVVKSPSSPGHYWGNWLIFDRPPEAGDRERWLAAFAAEFPDLGHCTLAWDVTDGALGAASEEFPDFELERMVGLIAQPAALRAHPRANRDVRVRALKSFDDEAWEQVLDIWLAGNAERDDPHPVEAYRSFAQSRLQELRTLIGVGRGDWFVAVEDGRVVASLGVVVTDGRARYQSVDTRSSHRRRGIASRLVFEAAQRTAAKFAVQSMVIAADPGYHALGIYESLGFERREQVTGVCRWAPEDTTIE
jgi:GNAT superfamily N-acetyltransferase